MSFSPSFEKPGDRASRRIFLLLLLMLSFSITTAFALPRRLIIELDGISYRDLQTLQTGVSLPNAKGRQTYRRAFHEGYFPVSRNISTFPSTSDVAWTDIFGDRPLPGYQRTYFSEAANCKISISSLTTSMEHERQMNWQVESGFRRAMAYVYPLHYFKYELRDMTEKFLAATNDAENYYAYIRSTDDAQHMSGDIFALLCLLDEKLNELRARYHAREGRDLEILIISDHGHNRAGPGKRVEVQAFLKSSGYHVCKSIINSRDVVLPTCGIESWVEIHNSPPETEKLAQRLRHMEGVDLVTARLPDATNHFLVINSRGERATIEWNPANDSFRYSTNTGDPLDYLPVVRTLAEKNQLDAKGFASADDWMAATMTHHYPLALERIAQGLTRITLNPATILLSLSNGYVNAGWFVKKTSRLMTQGGTHGGLDELSSDGIVLSNFAPTHDTSTSRVAGLYDDFPGLQNFRAHENGAEWITRRQESLTRIARAPIDSAYRAPSGEETLLRIWSPGLAHLDANVPVEITIVEVPRSNGARIHRWDNKSGGKLTKHLTLTLPLSYSEKFPCERVYALPSALILEPGKTYQMSGHISAPHKPVQIFQLTFRTDARGTPVSC